MRSFKTVIATGSSDDDGNVELDFRVPLNVAAGKRLVTVDVVNTASSISQSLRYQQHYGMDRLHLGPYVYQHIL